MKKITKIIVATIFFIALIWFCNTNISNAATTSTDINGINESKYPGYKSLLQAIQKEHPNWKIKLLYTGLDWNTVISNESTGHGSSPKSLIYDTYDEAWRCQKDSCDGVKYDVSKRWYCASDVAIKYMMDPRNSLDEEYIFQFQDLSSSVGERDAIVKMTQGTFLSRYVDAIMEAAESVGISPFHIVARIREEQGSSGIGAMNGYPYRTESGQYVVVYNLFNINVSGNDTEAGLLAGAKYAYEQGWTTPEASIKGGAEFIKQDYIDVGQTTLYFQKYDVIQTGGLYNNQYMQNIRAANDEGNTMYQAYEDAGILNSTFEFTIPVYENMPTSRCARPTITVTPKQSSYSVSVNQAIDINCTYSPSGLDAEDFTWTAEDPSILSVYWDRIRGLKEGTTNLVIKSISGSYTKKIPITVKKNQTATPSQSSYSITVNQSINIACTYSPSGTDAEDFTWTAENPSILSVYWNKIRGLKAGKTNLIIKSLDGTFTKKVPVTVKAQSISVTPSQSSYSINVNQAIDINCTYTPSGTDAEDFTWTAEDPSILSVYWDRVRGLKAGTTNLIVKSLNGSYTKKIPVTVKAQSISVTPSQSSYSINVNQAIDINCTYTPSGTNAEDFSWTAENPSILSVYWDRIRGLKAGTTNIIVKSLNGSYTKKIPVTVKAQSISVSLSQSSYSLKVNQAIDLSCTYSPTSLKAEDFSWTAEDPSILSVYWDRMRGLKAGTTNLIIKSLDGSYTKKVQVTITK